MASTTPSNNVVLSHNVSSCVFSTNTRDPTSNEDGPPELYSPNILEDKNDSRERVKTKKHIEKMRKNEAPQTSV